VITGIDRSKFEERGFTIAKMSLLISIATIAKANNISSSVILAVLLMLVLSP
jgi:hypothetical protein